MGFVRFPPKTNILWQNGQDAKDAIVYNGGACMYSTCSTLFRMELVEIMGKQNKKVPCLLTPEMRSALDALEATRDQAGIDPKNIYVFACVSMYSIVLN